MQRTITLAIVVIGVLAGFSPAAWAAQIGFIEDFSLAADREAALKQLIPGTEDFYYYTCLNQQNLGQLDKVDETLKAWIARYNRTPRVMEIENRQALLRYADQPRQSLDFIVRRLNLQFNHQKDAVAAERANLPTRLDPKLIAEDTLTRRALDHAPQTTAGFEPRALERLAATNLSGHVRRNLLSRLDRPDVRDLARLVDADLRYQNSGGFGSLPIHRQLLLSQLEELLKLQPALLNHDQFVAAYLQKLAPNPDVDVAHDLKARGEHLDRLWAFVSRLAPVHNSLKAHVLYQRLFLDRALGTWDKDRFMAYVKLPRMVVYINPLYLNTPENRDFRADLGREYPGTLLPPIRTDEELVRSYLAHFFVDAKDYAEFEPYIRDTFLKVVFAETKIVNQVGNMEQWYSMLSPDFYQALKDRVDIDFDYTRKEVYAADEPVALDVYVKNVKDLIVKVYEVNAANYYRTRGGPVDLLMDLDGLVANEEISFKYADPPLARVKRHFDLKSLAKRGVYIVELIGNGKSSRALVQKGQLRHLVRTSVAGHVFTILDESNKRITDAKLWLAGHEYTPDKDGLITVPFTHNPVMQPIVLSRGDFATLARFQHEKEEYRLVAGIFVDRESLLRREKASVILRPQLLINGHAAPVALLENVVLQITATDREGVSTSKEVRDPALKLFDDKESTYEFQVPDNLTAITFTLRAKVQNLSESRKDDLADGVQFPLNAIDATAQVDDFHLMHAAGQGDAKPGMPATAGYVLEVLGKTGEVRPGEAVDFELKHRDFTETVKVALRSDERGRIALGELKDIDWVRAGGPQRTPRQWFLAADRCAYVGEIHGKVGDAVYVPYVGKAAKAGPETFSLLERRGDTFVADRTSALTLENGFLVIQDLPRGDYDLLIKDSPAPIMIRLAEGEAREGYVLSGYRQLEVRDARPLQIASIEADAGSVKIRLANAGPTARVHVAATRYESKDAMYSLFDRLGMATAMRLPISAVVQPPETSYEVGRTLSDEYRYVLERKYAKKFPGNMLARPGLLLNPWSPTKTETALEALGQGAVGMPARRLDVIGVGAGGNAIQGPMGPGDSARFPNLDFLSQPAAVLANLKPDANGVVTIPRKNLGAHPLLGVLAVDAAGAVYREITLEEAKMPFLDLRLGTEALDPKKHFTEQKERIILEKGESLVVRDIGSSKVETYDSLARAYRLLATLSRNATLQKFDFILAWPGLKPEEKRAKYSEFACHELSFFLHKKDPDFFTKVVKPYLANKKDKTFMDRFLVGDDLSSYLKPWAYEQLNAAERILLAERMKEERDRTKRHVGDLYDLTPPDLNLFNTLFRTALLGSGLDTGGRGRLNLEAGKPMLADSNGAYRFEAAEALDESAALGVTSLAAAAAPGGARARAAGPAPAAPAEPAAKAPAPSRPTAAPMAPPPPADGKDRADKPAATAMEKSAEFAAGDISRRSGVRQLYREAGRTEEWAENNYYQLPIAAQNADLITVTAFWRDYAARDPAKPFLSTNLIYAGRSFTEIMLALALLDLPFEPAKHETAIKDATLTIRAGGPVIVFAREIKEVQEPPVKTAILVSQNFFRADDRYRYDGNERFDKFVTDEFLTSVVYGSQVVVTNPTSSPQKLEVLVQVPRGAMPVQGCLFTRSIPADLAPFSTRTFEYYFYFPIVGEYPQCPVQVARSGALIGFADPVTLKAVAKLSKVDTTSWDYVAQNGSEEEVVRYLKDNNINRLNLDRIAWRMQDKAFFQQAVALLAARHVYQNTLWSYALKHDDPAAAREFLSHQDGFIGQTGLAIDSPLLVINPVVRRMYQHLEYAPLVNARAHKVGRERTILNDRLAAQYGAFMKLLSYRRSLDDEDLMDVTYYLLLQDRVDEAIGFFGRVKPAKLPERIQYDYFAAYIDFYTEDTKSARAIAGEYAAYPVDRWRKLFAQVVAQLDEIQGKAAAVVDDKDRTEVQSALSATEPSIDLAIEGKTVAIDYQNLGACRVNYYLMDVELLFSKNPFVQQTSGQFAFVKPTESVQVALKEKKGTYKFELPKAYQARNVMVEVVAGGVRKSAAYYANSMVVQLMENYGQLKVTDLKGQALAKVYVKVYTRSGAAVAFYKDGYTDLRGRFDYTSLNTGESAATEKFAILVLSDTEGAVVREANPPKR